MRPISELQDALFENRGPLQDFSARIQVAFALNLIDRGTFVDLNALRDIRNAFAHTPEALDFDRPDVAEKCNALWYPSHLKYKDSPTPTTPREMFVRDIELLADLMIETEGYLIKQAAIPMPRSYREMGPPWPPRKPQPSPKKPRTRVSRRRPTRS